MLLQRLALVAAAAPALAEAAVFDITSYGAQPCPELRGRVFKLLCPEVSASIARAFAAASAAGGGTVRVPPGHWTTMPFNLSSHTTLKLERGAVLQAPIENQPGAGLAAWPLVEPLPTYAGGFDFQGSGFRKYHPLVFGYKLRNVSIEGPGAIDGAGVYWLTRVGYDCAASGAEFIAPWHAGDGQHWQAFSNSSAAFAATGRACVDGSNHEFEHGRGRTLPYSRPSMVELWFR